MRRNGTILIEGRRAARARILVPARCRKAPLQPLKVLNGRPVESGGSRSFSIAGAFQCRLLHFRKIMSSGRPAANESESSQAEIVQILARNGAVAVRIRASSRSCPPGGQNDAGAQAMSNVEGRKIVSSKPEAYEFTTAPLHQFEWARRDFFLRFLAWRIAVFAIAKRCPCRAGKRLPGRGRSTNEELPKTLVRGCTSARR